MQTLFERSVSGRDGRHAVLKITTQASLGIGVSFLKTEIQAMDADYKTNPSQHLHAAALSEYISQRPKHQLPDPADTYISNFLDRATSLR